MMEKEIPKVSIIVPVYNVEKYLERCLDSLINQKLKDIEIICVNDGSTDSSLEILKKYAEKDFRIKVIDKKNTGVSDCRNLAIKESKGEFLVFVDSDDWIDLNMLDIMYAKTIEENSDLIMCTYIREFSNHSKEKLFNMPKERVYENLELKSLHRKLFGPINEELGNPEGLDAWGTVWGKLYRSEIIKRNKFMFKDLNIIGSNEDSLFNIYFFNKINKAVFINRALYHYWRENEGSITSKYNSNLKVQWSNLFDDMERFIKKNNLDENYEIALNNRICMSVLGLGLNECSKNNKSSNIKKINNIKSIINDKRIVYAYKNFEIRRFPMHWKIFYFFNKNKMPISSYLMINLIDFLRTRI